MDAELKAKWIKTLRGQGDRKYEQGWGQLRTSENKYCCLGVLGDLIDPSAWEQDMAGAGHQWNGRYYLLPPDILSLPVQEKFSNLNDVKAYSFIVIADCIERGTISTEDN